MKKALMVIVLGLFIVSMMGAVSATVDDRDTNIGGTIYNSDFSSTISGATVTVTCNNATDSTTSNANGVYGVAFDVSECTIGDLVTVVAIKDDLSGVESEFVYDFGLTVNLAVVNVPMTPEFGFVLGLMTLLSAVGIFFVVRRD